MPNYWYPKSTLGNDFFIDLFNADFKYHHATLYLQKSIQGFDNLRIFRYLIFHENHSTLHFRFRLINAVKPHTSKVSMMVMEPRMNLIITGSDDKSLFFFKFHTSEKGIDMDPIRCVTLDYVAINFEWLSNEVKILIHGKLPKFTWN